MLTPPPVSIENKNSENTKNPSKNFELILDNKKYEFEISIIQNYLNFKCTLNNSFPSKIFSNQYSNEDLSKLCKKFFLDEPIEVCLTIIVELIENKEYSIKESENMINLTFSPKQYKIQEFTITLTLNQFEEVQQIHELYKKVNELIEENKILKQQLNNYNNYLNNNIMLISNQSNPLLSNLLNLHKSINKISIITPSYILSRLTEQNIQSFKIIIYDLQDSGYGNTNNKEDLNKYLLNGGNIIITHDQWSNAAYISPIELLNAKLSYQGNEAIKIVNKVKIKNNSHPVFNSLYNLSYLKDSVVQIELTHKTHTVYNDIEEYNKNLIIELDDGRHGEYLYIREIGKGKVIFWNAGHSKDINDFEQKLFMNLISWIFQ